VGVTCVCYQIYTTVVLGPLAKYLDRELENMDEKELEEAEVEPIFIAFPFTTKMVPAAPYRGSDEEWQTFVKISKDKNLQMKIRSTSTTLYG
jgi:hypothetical protein